VILWDDSLYIYKTYIELKGHMMEKIEKTQMEYTELASLDSCGKTFRYKGKFLRGIYHSHEEAIKEMFDCGLVEALVKMRLIPDTTLSDYFSDEFPVILEHEVITPVTYIFEWTYHMLCDAAQMIFDLNEVLAKYGYKLWDCHSYNILFKNNKPLYVDFGSFYKADEKIERTFPLREFKCDYIVTSSLLRRNGALLRDLLKVNDTVTLSDITRIRKGLGRPSYMETVSEILGALHIKFYSSLPFYERFLIQRYGRKVRRMQTAATTKGRWSDYQQVDASMLQDIESWNSEEFKRFNRIIALIEKLEIESVYEWGCNNGLLAILICGRFDMIKDYYCCDYDDYSVDNLYCFIKREAPKYRWLNKIKPIVGSFFDPINLKSKNGNLRMKSDLVIGCAIAHHLLLAQGINIDILFETFASYTRKFILIEFMPLGLWDGTGVEAPLPEYYTLDWFLEHMSKKFDVNLVEQTEKNRILVFGKLRF